MGGSTFRVVEHLGEEVPLGLLDSLRLLELVHGLLAFLLGGRFLGAFLGLSNIKGLVGLLVELFSLHILKFAVDIVCEVLFLNALPLVAVSLCRVEGETDLILRELAVLAERVQTHHVLHLLRRERLRLDLGPDTFVAHVLLIVGLAFFFAVLFLLLVLFLELLLLLETVLAVESVPDSVVVRINEQARVVLEADGQVRTKARHFEEVDTWLSNDLLDEDVLEVLALDRVPLLVHLVLEDVEGETTLFVKNLVHKELVLFVCMGEVDDFLRGVVDVGLIIIVVRDRLLRGHELADIDGRRTRVFLEVIGQVL